jgi:DNA-binding MarR family transcriptional regulator
VTLSIPAAPAGDTNGPTDRALLEQALAEELSSWGPRDFLFTFLRLHKGSLSMIHLTVLTLLEVDGPVPMGRLAELLDVSVASITGIVTRMEARGLVERAHAQHDRRIVLVHATAAGIDVFRHIAEQRRAGLHRLLARMSDAELTGFLAGHRALRAARAALIAETAATTEAGRQ